MKTVYDVEKDNMDTILMRVYGLSEMQCGILNSDYKQHLLNNYMRVLERNYKLEQNYKKENAKVKILSIFKRK